jgi:hypothetical protein
MSSPYQDPVLKTLPPEEEAVRRASQRRRSIALGLALAAVVLIFYVLTIVKMGPAILIRPL